MGSASPLELAIFGLVAAICLLAAYYYLQDKRL